MKITPATPAKAPTLRQMHARKCFLLGIDPCKWDRLWQVERERIEKARKEAEGYRPGNRHGRRRA